MSVLFLAIVCIFLAAGFYTFSIFKERRIKYLTPGIVGLFTLGFLCDTIGTSIMFYIAGSKFHISLHSMPGYFALFFMLAHLLWAMIGLCRAGRCQRYFTKYSIWAWRIWMVAFISGIVLNLF